MIMIIWFDDAYENSHRQYEDDRYRRNDEESNDKDKC